MYSFYFSAGLFADSHASFEINRDHGPQGEPSLAQMVAVAMKRLSRSPEGYVLLVGDIGSCRSPEVYILLVGDLSSCRSPEGYVLLVGDLCSCRSPAEVYVLLVGCYVTHSICCEFFSERKQQLVVDCATSE